MTMAKMKAMVGPKTGDEFEIQQREIPQPDAGEVRIDSRCSSGVLWQFKLLATPRTRVARRNSNR